MACKRKERAVILSQEQIGEQIFSMWLQTEEIGKEAVPGQFLSLYTADKSKLLPRPISLCEIGRENARLRIVYRVTGEGTGTEQFSRLSAGDFIEILGPLGNGFPLEAGEGRRTLLIGGGIGVPPMLELSKQLDAQKQIVMGYRGETFLTEEFEKTGSLYLATEDGGVGTKGTVMDAIRENELEADVIFACGPAPMLRAVKEYGEGKNIPCYLSMEERMACGVGACLACVCKSRDVDPHSHVQNKRVCKDGPVFLSTEVEIE